MRCLKSLLAFFTAFPIGGAELSFKCVWALPYVAAPIIAAIPTTLLYLGGSPAIAYIALLAATGLHHLDGLADVGDALLVRDREAARRVLEDPRRGTGGIFAVTAVVVTTAAHLHSPLQLLLGEVFSKSTALLFAGFSKSFKPGLGEAFTEAAKRQWPAALPALAVLAYLAPVTTAVSLATSALLYQLAYRHLGGANGDVYGYLLEVSRSAFVIWSAYVPVPTAF
ncbi:adenosylcobinamide-GDP ribazoletransferase [Pyrobaculum sp.]|uniref:adenosylcobinamide-GDP ribazoletransferase n=1 Tax=Pyrobaculum sp. TaxID=2004705 RepID=UPI00317E998D